MFWSITVPDLASICRHIRSKNAGPFWITIDLTFADPSTFEQYANSEALQSPAIAKLFGVEPRSVKRFLVVDLSVLKISFPRLSPQGGAIERDMHGGQQYIRLLDVQI
jgi:hypothetical protein